MEIKKAYQLTMFNDLEQVFEFKGEQDKYSMAPRTIKPDKTGKDESAFRRHTEGCIMGYFVDRISVKKFLKLVGSNSDEYHFRFYPIRQRIILVFPKWNDWTLLERCDKHYAMVKYLDLPDEVIEFGNASSGFISSRTANGKRAIAKIFMEHYSNEARPSDLPQKSSDQGNKNIP